jgi:two-component system, NtrC family, nitrogen regulation sensor histidine kinase NtrY
MKRGSLRVRLIVVFLAATLVPLALTVWTSIELLGFSLNLTPVRELDTLSKSFERVSREYYQRARDWLKADAQSGRVTAQVYAEADQKHWPPEVQEFWENGTADRFDAAGADGRVLQYFERSPHGVRVYSRELGIGMDELTRDFAQARDVLAFTRNRDLRRGFVYTFVAVASAVWIAGLLGLVYFARRLTAPVHGLTQALTAVGRGDLRARVDREARNDEIGQAIEAFNNMADQLQESREKLIHVTRLASWQALARKMAHEVKNSLTPIRLTMEEISARSMGPDAEFLRQAAQIVVDEVTSLEKRVRAFSEFAAEPPVCPAPVDINSLVEERVSFLRSAHPEVIYNLELSPDRPAAQVDADLIKGVCTNLLQNAAEAARAGGVVLLRTALGSGKVLVEVHDSGPGLSLQVRSTVFEPTISFKKGGMGLGLSIARKSALLCGGDIALIDGQLGGAAFRVSLPACDVSVPSIRAREQTADSRLLAK